MRLGSVRRLLSVLISGVLALSLTALLGGFLYSQTIGSADYIKKKLVTDALVQQCGEQLDLKYTELAAESGIPQHVFSEVKEGYGIAASLSQAAENIFGAEDTSLYNNHLIEYFVDLLKEYLDADGIPYAEKDIRYTAERAAAIYSETVGMHQVGNVRYDLTSAAGVTKSLVFFSAVTAVVCGMLLALLFSDKRKMTLYLFGALTSCGVGTLLTCAAAFLFRVTQSITVTPSAYQSALNSMTASYFLLLAAAGVAVTVFSLPSALALHKKMNNHSPRGIAV